MGQALYRKYRSKKLSEIIGQDHITHTLSAALKKGSISHAYLFTGPHGVGKTSVARIMAHEVNGLPYDEEATHLDIIEIDAASNRRIDEIRQLKERVHTAPASAKYKVYIIDEVHMLTKEAFNALLKTLEEPPAHAIFILATTEVHKLPETIISRTQRFTFKPIEITQAVKHLSDIAKSEKIDIDPVALELIAAHGDGSFRDSISLLDQLSTADKQITAEEVQTVLGVLPSEELQQLLNALTGADSSKLVSSLQHLRERGYLANQIAQQLAKQLRADLLQDKLHLSHDQTTQLLRELIEVPLSHDPDSLLEIILLTTSVSSAKHAVSSPTPQLEPTDSNPQPKETSPPRSEAAPVPVENPSSPAKTTAEVAAFDDSLWQEILQTIKQQYSTLYSIARMVTPRYANNTLTLECKFAFHQKRLSETKNQEIIATILKERLGARALTIVCELKPEAQTQQATGSSEQGTTNQELDSISNIFGSAEVLES